MSQWTWHILPSEDEPTCEAVLLCDGAEVDRESFEDPKPAKRQKAANDWVGRRLRELGVL